MCRDDTRLSVVSQQITSRVSCNVVYAAQVEETLKPKALSMGNGLTWEGMVEDLQPKQPWPSTAKLTAYALYDGTYTNDKAGEAPSVVPVLTSVLLQQSRPTKNAHRAGP